MMRTSFFWVFAVCFFSISWLEAKEIPQSVINKCREKAKKANPIKITYNYGTLSIDYSKKVCEDVAGVFHGKNGCYLLTDFYNIQVGKYTCSFPYADIRCDFSGVYIDLCDEYSGCNARAVLRHELQHFMIWKTAKENMIKEMNTFGTDFVLRNIKVCEGACYNKTYNELLKNLKKISEKWEKIENANDKRLDEIDHDYKSEVNYTVCAPYSMEVELY